MKVPKVSGRGSMGIPDSIHPDKMLTHDVAEHPAHHRDPGFDPALMDDVDVETGDEVEDEEAAATAEAAKESEPTQILKRLGVELGDEDFNKLLFKGYVEKVIKLCFDPLTKKPFTATFKTLTGQEYDEVDELLADEMERLKMTVNGRDARRSTWLLAFAMTHINGMPLQKPVVHEGTLDARRTAEARIKVIRALSPFILDKASRTYAAFTTAVALLVEDPEKNFIKKP